MRSCIIPKRAPSAAWDNVPVLAIDTVNWENIIYEADQEFHRKAVENIKAFAQIAWDERALYVRLTAREPFIRAENTGLLAQPCEDSCLEFFFMPDAADPENRYFNIEFNPNALCFLGFGKYAGALSLIRLQPFGNVLKPKVTFLRNGQELPSAKPPASGQSSEEFDESATSVPRSVIPEQADGWSVEYEIPGEFVSRFFPGFTWHEGLRIRANAYKCGDLTPSPHYLSWNPMDPGIVSFHRPDHFGEMILR